MLLLFVVVVVIVVDRIEGASHINKRNLLQLILPWLHNIELVDVLVLPLQDTLPLQRTQYDTTQSGLKGTGWGCHQASELVLNNLLFLTIEHSLEFSHEVQFVCLFVVVVVYE